jgi:hypothetical protein
VYFPYVAENIAGIIGNRDKRHPFFQLKSADGRPVKVRLELIAAIRS